MTERPTLSRNLALDGLRGLSIIVVILYHSGVVSGGWIGVEVFFVLSGYLITTLLLLELDGTGRIDVVAFWKRRARRLLPGIGLLLVLIGLYTAWFSERTSSTIDLDIFGVLTYTSNWTTIAGDGYWATFATPSPLRHMWSLAVEEQFYLVFPLLALWLLLPRRRRWAVPTLTTAALAWQVAATSFFDINRVYLGTDTRAFGLLAGATAAVALHETRSRRANTGPGTQRWQPMAGLAAIVVLAVGVVVLSEDTDGLFRGPFQLVVCAAVALTTVIADRDRSGWLGHALSAGPLVHIGRWSYGIYLFHWPILIALEPGTPKQPWLLALAVSALAIPLAALSFRWIEVPIMRTGLRAFKPQSIGWVAGAVALAVGIFAASTAIDAPPTVEEIAALEASRAPSAPDATVAPTLIGDTGPEVVSTLPAAAETEVAVTIAGLTSLAQRPADRPARVYIVGDSLGTSVDESLAPLLGDLDIEVFSRAAGSCGYDRTRMRYLTGDLQPEVCTDLVSQWRNDVLAFQPDAVLFVYGAWWGWTFEGSVQTQCDAPLAAHVRSLYDLAVDDLSASGAPVFMVNPATWNGDPVGPPDIPRYFGCLTDVLSSFVSANASTTRLVDVATLLCADDSCESTVAGAATRPDGVHFTGDAAPTVMVEILRRVLTPPVGGWPTYGQIEPAS